MQKTNLSVLLHNNKELAAAESAIMRPLHRRQLQLSSALLTPLEKAVTYTDCVIKHQDHNPYSH